MTIQERLVQLLGSIVGNRLYPLIAPDSPTLPYAVYLRVASTTENTLSDGSPIDNTHLQIDVYDRSYAGANAVAAAIEAAIETAALAGTLAAVKLSSQDLFEPETRLYRVLMEFSLWH